MIGVDLAEMDYDTKAGPVDWRSVRQQGVGFVLLRAYDRKSGLHGKDRRFDESWAQVRAAGLVRGAYLFTRPWEHDALEDVTGFLDVLGPLGPGDLPPVLDLEQPDWAPALSGDDAVDFAVKAVQLITARLGVRPIIYTSHRVWDECWRGPDDRGLGECPLWVVDCSSRQDPRLPSAWRDRGYWLRQYALERPLVSGVKSADRDRFHLLQHGERGARAAWLNQALGVPGDEFGDQTSAALADFQRTHGLEADGIVGPRTFSQLCFTPGTAVASVA